MALNTLIRKALPSEIETLADIAFVAWERDLQPFLSGAAASRDAERHRLNEAVRDGLDRIIVAEVNTVAVGWCQRARGRAYIPFLFVTPLLQNNGVGSALLRRMESIIELEGRRPHPARYARRQCAGGEFLPASGLPDPGAQE